MKNKNESTSNKIHSALDIAGYVPIVGTLGDGVNALFYLIEGDRANAAISGAAMLPFV